MTSAAKLATALACVVSLAGSSPVSAQDDVWPTRPVRLVAPSGPGGNPDVLARLLADKFSAAFGRPFVVENVPGAGGVVAANMVAKAARGGSAMVNGLLTGEIQAGWSGIPNVMELIAAGKLRGLCVSTLQRSSSTPTIPTCDELGLTGFNIATMMGLHAPAGTSPKIVARLQVEIAQSMREPAMAARMAQLGMVMEESGTSHYAAFMREDMARYEQAVRTLNLQQPK
jgi:tripartite-type tricarboxylate transporter receptor subunit TctC